MRRPASPEQEGRLLSEIYGQMATGCLWPRHVATLVYVIACLAQGETLAPGESVSRDEHGPVLSFDPRYGLLGNAAGEEPFSLDVLQHLRDNSWITGTRNGSEIELRLGSRAKRVFEAVPPKAVSK